MKEKIAGDDAPAPSQGSERSNVLQAIVWLIAKGTCTLEEEDTKAQGKPAGKPLAPSAGVHPSRFQPKVRSN